MTGLFILIHLKVSTPEINKKSIDQETEQQIVNTTNNHACFYIIETAVARVSGWMDGSVFHKINVTVIVVFKSNCKNVHVQI